MNQWKSIIYLQMNSITLDMSCTTAQVAAYTGAHISLRKTAYIAAPNAVLTLLQQLLFLMLCSCLDTASLRYT